MVPTYRPSTITPVHRSWSRPPSDTRHAALRANSSRRRQLCPEGSTGRSRLCRRSESLRTRHGRHERTSEPKAHARPSMWRPCSPDGEVCIGPRPPLRDPAPNWAKTVSPLELTLGTFVIHTQTKLGSHGGVPGDLRGGPGGRRTAPTAEASAMRDPRGGKRVKESRKCTLKTQRLNAETRIPSTQYKQY